MPSTFNKIASVTVGSGGAATMAFTSIPATYTDLALKISSRYSGGGYGTDMTITINGSTSSFSSRRIYAYSNTIYTDTQSNVSGVVNGTGSTSNTFSFNNLYFPNYAGSLNKSYIMDSSNENNDTTAYLLQISGNLWANSAAINSITIGAASSFVQYSTATLYGIKNS
jgi:hypothetical protein